MRDAAGCVSAISVIAETSMLRGMPLAALKEVGREAQMGHPSRQARMRVLLRMLTAGAVARRTIYSPATASALQPLSTGPVPSAYVYMAQTGRHVTLPCPSGASRVTIM